MIAHTFDKGVLTWENKASGAAGCVNTGRPLTRLLDHRERGLAMKATQACVVPGCDRYGIKRKMCNRHYLAWWKRTPAAERPRPTAEQRFWAKVRKGPRCWEWTGAKRSSGHGQFAVSRTRTIPASAYSLELHLGYPTPEGMEACHRCDNPPCVNPRHLYYGTRQENVDDAWARGRMPVGSQRAAAKLIEEQVVAIREEYAAGGDARLLAERYGIAVPTLRLIVLGRKWTQVGGPITRRRPSTRKAS